MKAQTQRPVENKIIATALACNCPDPLSRIALFGVKILGRRPIRPGFGVDNGKDPGRVKNQGRRGLWDAPEPFLYGQGTFMPLPDRPVGARDGQAVQARVRAALGNVLPPCSKVRVAGTGFLVGSTPAKVVGPRGVGQVKPKRPRGDRHVPGAPAMALSSSGWVTAILGKRSVSGHALSGSDPESLADRVCRGRRPRGPREYRPGSAMALPDRHRDWPQRPKMWIRSMGFPIGPWIWLADSAMLHATCPSATPPRWRCFGCSCL